MNYWFSAYQKLDDAVMGRKQSGVSDNSLTSNEILPKLKLYLQQVHVHISHTTFLIEQSKYSLLQHGVEPIVIGNMPDCTEEYSFFDTSESLDDYTKIMRDSGAQCSLDNPSPEVLQILLRIKDRKNYAQCLLHRYQLLQSQSNAYLKTDFPKMSPLFN